MDFIIVHSNSLGHFVNFGRIMIDQLDKTIPIFGTLVNVISVLIGSTIGLLIHTKLHQKYISIAFQGIGLITIFLGIQMALNGKEIILIIFSILVGGILGEMLSLEEKVNQLLNSFQSRNSIGGKSLTEGLITAFLLFCLGSMTFLGAIEEGTGHFPNLLLAKSLMDGFSSVALASTLGIGVMFSIIPLFLYQSGLTLFASYLTHILNQSIINEMTATGGILLIGLGIHLLKLREIKVLNLIPSLGIIILLKLLF